MGNFYGHLLPGGFLFFWGIFYAFHNCRRYFHAKQRSSLRSHKDDDEQIFYFTRTDFYCGCECGRRIPIYSFILILIAVYNIYLVYSTALKDVNGRFVDPGNFQHVAMYALLIMVAIVEALRFIRVPWLPYGVEYATQVLASTGVAILFSFHIHDPTSSPPHIGSNTSTENNHHNAQKIMTGHMSASEKPVALSSTLHSLLAYTIWACVVTSVVEMSYRRSVMASLVRTYFTSLQGMWFIVVGFILYPPLEGYAKWDDSNHEHIMLAVAVYCWAAAASVVVILCVVVVAFLTSAVCSAGVAREISFRRAHRNSSSASTRLLVSDEAIDADGVLTKYDEILNKMQLFVKRRSVTQQNKISCES